MPSVGNCARGHPPAARAAATGTGAAQLRAGRQSLSRDEFEAAVARSKDYITQW